MRSKADETLVIVETLICPLQISHKTSLFLISSLASSIKSREHIEHDCIGRIVTLLHYGLWSSAYLA